MAVSNATTGARKSTVFSFHIHHTQSYTALPHQTAIIHHHHHISFDTAALCVLSFSWNGFRFSFPLYTHTQLSSPLTFHPKSVLFNLCAFWYHNWGACTISIISLAFSDPLAIFYFFLFLQQALVAFSISTVLASHERLPSQL